MNTTATPTTKIEGYDRLTMGINFVDTGPSHGLVLESFECVEELSSLFSIEACLSTSLSLSEAEVFVQPKMFVGKKAIIRVDLPEDNERFFCGVIAGLEQTGRDDRRVYYRCEIVPWLWLLSLTSDCRVYQGMSVVQIVQQTVQDLSRKFPHLLSPNDLVPNLKSTCGTDGEDGANGEHSKRDICVQYNETTLNFMMRLLEEEGICFFFRHSADACQMVLADAPAKHGLCPHQTSLYEMTHLSEPQEEEGALLSWSQATALTAGTYELRDNHFEEFCWPIVKRDARKDVEATGLIGGNDRLELYEYGDGFAEPYNEAGSGKNKVLAEGERRAKWRIEAETSGQRMYAGSSTCAAISPGFTFHLDPSPKEKKTGPLFLITTVSHSAGHAAPSKEEVELVYHNEFRCMPAEVAFRPPRTTPRPVIQGVQTAVVSRPNDPQAKEEAAEQIVVDKFGRVRVRFDWDRHGAEDGVTSAWIRVGQAWASGGFGIHFWPRVGDEVIVAFLDGDPDRPIIVGSVYNARNMPPYELPAEKTKSGIKTRSTPGGDMDNFNEIRFEDRKGHEQVYIHAERNLKTVVEAADSRSVGASRSTTIGHDDKLTVRKGDRTAEIEKGKDELKIQEGNREVGIAQGDDVLFVVNGNSDIDVPAGHYHVRANEIVLDATSSLTLRCGPSEIVLRPGTISINVPGGNVDLVPGMIDIGAPLVMINS